MFLSSLSFKKTTVNAPTANGEFSELCLSYSFDTWNIFFDNARNQGSTFSKS